MVFQFHRLRLRFRAVDCVSFPAVVPGNVLRGAFGTIFRKLTCSADCPGARDCPWRDKCAYARTFEPSSASGPSGLQNRPRPFVFRATELEGRSFPAGEEFGFEVHLFETKDPPLPAFERVFAEVAREGIGRGRGRAVLEQFSSEPVDVCLAPPAEPVDRVEVRFVTPTELKSGEDLAARPEFGILMARVRDRLSTLMGLYGSGPLEVEFAAFGRRASAIRMTSCDLVDVERSRFSTRTGQRHPLGGFQGVAVYEGDVSEFVPYLEAAQYTGVGRQTTWGKGQILIRQLR